MDNAFHYVESKPDLFSEQAYKTYNVSGQQENDDLRDVYDKKLGVEAVTTEDDKIFLQNIGKAKNEPDGLIATTEILRTKTTSEMNGLVRSFTPEQRKVFCYNFSWLRATGQYRTKPAPRLIVHGAGGTRKSFLVQAVAFFGHRAFALRGFDFHRNVVGLFALTGVASFKLDGGMVINSSFAMNRANPNQFLKPLGAVKLAQLRTMWLNLQIVTNHGMSMMSPVKLAHPHQRLCEIKGLNHYSKTVPLFANVAVILMRDLLQLTPVKARSIFETPSNPYMANQDIWKQFSFIELSKTMRQEDDKHLAQPLSRLRVGEQTDAEKNSMKNRVSPLSQDHPRYPLSTIHLFASFDSAQEHNEFLLKKLSQDEVNIEAKDTIPKVPTYFEGSLASAATSNRREIGGLQTVLRLKVGARLMLVRNIDAPDVLVNGAMGVILGHACEADEVTRLFVKFDDPNVGLKARNDYRQSLGDGVPLKNFFVTFAHAREKSIQVWLFIFKAKADKSHACMFTAFFSSSFCIAKKLFDKSVC